jgi:DNA topoisomerase-1
MFRTDEEGKIMVEEPPSVDEKCPLCGGAMLVKEGRYGKFLACSRYPDCKGTRSLSIGVACPQEGCGGSLVQRRTKKGRIFYGCNKYPDCRFALWERPVAQPCPQCGATFLVEKRRKDGVKLVCKQEGCDYQTDAPSV